MIKSLRKLFQIIVILLGTIGWVKAQTVYTTSFNAGHGWTLNTYNNLNTTVEGDSPNIWYVSDAESNKGAGNIGGSNCGNVTLHMGSTTIGDGGAAYDAGGCTNLGFGPCASCLTNGLYCVTTDRSAVSPAINTTGITGLTLSFLYIHWGTALLDNGQIIYSVNGGTSWTLLANIPKSGCCTGAASCAAGCTSNATCTGSHQGKWTSYSSALPVSCENISNLKVGFRWYNDDVSTNGRDPSVAVDDITITTSVLPVKSSLLQAQTGNYDITLTWETYAESNNEGFDIERASDALEFEKIGSLQGQGNSDGAHAYTFIDTTAKPDQLYYYRYKQKDADGRFSYSNIVFGELVNTDHFKIYPNPANDKVTLSFDRQDQQSCSVQLADPLGKIVREYVVNGLSEGHGECVIDVKGLSPGIYFYKVTGLSKFISGKLMVEH